MGRSFFRYWLFDDSDEDEIMRRVPKGSTSSRKCRRNIELDCLAGHKRHYLERGLHLYTCMWIFKVGRLSMLIFGRFYICMWIFKVSKFE